MSRQRRMALVALVCLAAVMVVLLVKPWFMSRGGGGPVPAASVPDLSDHPVYRDYHFGKADHVIDFGTQPVWLPTCMISETMRRDVLLKKALAEQGLEIQFHSFLKGADVNYFLARGDLEVGIGGDMPALSAAANSGVHIVALTQQGFCSIVAREDMLMEELRGKRIAYAFGSNAHYALLQSLASAGLRERDVRLIPLDVTEMPDALADGTINAFSAWEPTPTIALAKHEDLVVIHRSLSSGYLYLSRSFADRYPEAVRQIVASELRALNWLRRRQENMRRAGNWSLAAGKELSGQAPMLSARDYVSLARNDLLGISSVAAIPLSDTVPDGRLCREFEFLKGLKKVPAAIAWEQVRSCFDRTAVKQVLSAPQQYPLETSEYADSTK